jgi:hypothetical protein
MDNASQIERELMALPPVERVRLVLKTWETLVDDPEAVADPDFDPEGLQLAQSREEELDQGTVRALTHREFRRRTNDS